LLALTNFMRLSLNESRTRLLLGAAYRKSGSSPVLA
jgi:hypothetical protein